MSWKHSSLKYFVLSPLDFATHTHTHTRAQKHTKSHEARQNNAAIRMWFARENKQKKNDTSTSANIIPNFIFCRDFSSWAFAHSFNMEL